MTRQTKLSAMITAAIGLILSSCQEKPKPPPLKAVAVEFRPAAVIAAAKAALTQITVRSGSTFLVDAVGLDTYAYPGQPPWHLTCGVAGLRLMISPGGDDNTDVTLSDQPMDASECGQVVEPVMTSARARFSGELP